MFANTCRKCGATVDGFWEPCSKCGKWFPISGPLISYVAVTLTLGAFLTLGLSVVRYVRGPAPHIATDNGFRHVATEIITKQLRDPATAVFAPDDEWTFERRGDNECLMRAWAEARDELRVQVRNHFTILVEHDGKDYWEVKYLKFDEQDAALGKLE